MPAASRGVVRWPNEKRAISCANRTSTKAKVRTLAALVSAKARNQNCEATAPMKPANNDGFQALRIAVNTFGACNIK